MKLAVIKFFMMALCGWGLLACTPQAAESKSDNKTESSSDITYSQGIQNGSMIGLDVRSAEEVAAHGSPQALNIPLPDLENKIDLLDKSKTILVFCESGGRAGRAKALLESKGFTKVENITDWRHWHKIIKK